MDKASVYGTGDCRFESYQDQFLITWRRAWRARSANIFESAGEFAHEKFLHVIENLSFPAKSYRLALLAQWLERAAVNRKVTGSIPVGSGFFCRRQTLSSRWRN